ncbi:MAG: CocE/NonD family hydrolase C-terminal non-catalytic domain-containing protein, partial [Sciscionella sp.]
SDATAIQIRGSARLHTTVTPSTADTSLFAYLYDVGPFGFGSLITCKPYSLRDATPGKAQTVDFTLKPDVWNVPAGHHLSLVVDTVDPRYLGISTVGSTVTFSSPAGDPSYLRVPHA